MSIFSCETVILHVVIQIIDCETPSTHRVGESATLCSSSTVDARIISMSDSTQNVIVSFGWL